MCTTSEQSLRAELLTAEANENFSEAALHFSDDSRLYFCHRVDERWAEAAGAGGSDDQTGLAGELLSAITMFRLNAKHLDIQFQDGSRWDQPIAPAS